MQSWYRPHPYGVYPRGNACHESDIADRFGGLSGLVFAQRADVDRMQRDMRRRAGRQRRHATSLREVHGDDTPVDEDTVCVDAEQTEQPYLDILLHILSFCEVPDLCRLSRSCTSWYVMVHATEALKAAYIALSPNYLNFDQNWKETAVKAHVVWAQNSSKNSQEDERDSHPARLGTRRCRAEKGAVTTCAARVLGEGWSHCPVPVRRHYYSDILFHAWICVILPTHYHLRRVAALTHTTPSFVVTGAAAVRANDTEPMHKENAAMSFGEEGERNVRSSSAACSTTQLDGKCNDCVITAAAVTATDITNESCSGSKVSHAWHDANSSDSAVRLLCAASPLPRVQYTSSFQPVERIYQPTIEQFVAHFEQRNRPVILTGIATEWPLYHVLQQRFTNLSDKKQALLRPGADPAFAFRCEHTRMSLNSYVHYATHQCDERPIYLFDAEFAQVMQSEALYTVPPHFSRDDYFAVLGQSQRPKYRWLIAGPARGGSSFHVDPNYTNAWNANLTGRKRWLLFPPGRPPPGVLPSANMAEVATPVSLTEWLLNYYDASVAELGSVGYECVCEPGEIMFVPSGWWHYVINLEDSVAITHNYVSRSNVQQVVQFLRAMPHSISGIDEDRDCVTAEQTRRRQRSFAAEFESAMTAAHPEVMRAVEEKLRAARCARAECRVGHLTRLDASTEGFKFDF